MKEKALGKLMLIFIVIPISIVSLSIFLILHAWDEIDCDDTGFCKQGVEFITKDGLVKTTKENCIKYDGKWIEQDKTCNFNKPSKQ